MKNEDKKKNKEKIDFFSLSRLFWKEQTIFYFLTILSCLGSQLLDINSFNNLLDFSKTNSQKKTLKLALKIGFFNLWEKNFDCGSKKEKTIWSLIFLFIIFFYAIIVFFHIWYSFVLMNKINLYIKKKSFEKLFLLNLNEEEEKTVVTTFTTYIKNFSDYVFFMPNQIFYIFLDFLLIICNICEMVKKDKNLTFESGVKIIFFGTFLSFFTTFVFWLIGKMVYKSELFFEKEYEKISSFEQFIIKKRELIIKKDEIQKHREIFFSNLKTNLNRANERDIFRTLSFVIPSYFLIKIFETFSCLIVETKEQFGIAQQSFKVFSSVKKISERIKEFPIFQTSQKKINDFLLLEERDDNEKGLIIKEKIRKITFENIWFSYYKNEDKWVLKNLNIVFEEGKINYLEWGNGSGKSTTLKLIVALFQAQKGKIIINEKYYLKDLNLIDWRKKIAYFEHSVLNEEKRFSTGEKQLLEINESFENLENKDIVIFDEADNALDKINKAKVRERLKEISSKKIVIFVSH